MLEGVILMFVGMSVVFMFLVLMVYTMQASTAFFQKFAHLFPEPEPAKKAKPARAAGGANDNAEIAIAIAAVKALTK